MQEDEENDLLSSFFISFSFRKNTIPSLLSPRGIPCRYMKHKKKGIRGHEGNLLATAEMKNNRKKIRSIA